MATARAKGRPLARSKARLKARRVILGSAGEQMIAVIRMHVAGCPRCEMKICGEGMQEILAEIDARLAASMRTIDARAVKDSAARRMGRRR